MFFHEVKLEPCSPELFAMEGGGVDIVSGGELYRALKAGIAPAKIVYSGVGKRVEDLEYGLESGIFMFNVESTQEIAKLNEVAGRLGKKAKIAIRVNPDVDPKTHPYISTGLKENKFGIDINEAPEQYAMAAGLGNLEVSGVSCHIGSQLDGSASLCGCPEKDKRFDLKTGRIGDPYQVPGPWRRTGDYL